MLRTPRCVLQAFACTAMLATTALADTPAAENSIRTGDGLLGIRAAMPEQARVGESFTYKVEVTNHSDNVVLHNIQLKQRKAKGFSIESVSMQGQEQQSSKQNKNDKQQNKADKQQNKSSDKASSGSQDNMKIAMLKPGESRTFTVQATADEEGELRSCLEIASYTPALCLTSQVVKPELELTKTAPKKANRCNAFELTYTVKNGGTGDVGKFTVTDSLGDGLATIEGDTELSFPVDGLKAGDTREFVARVYAQKPGEFSSRAVAKAENSDLNSRSQKTTTKVNAADLMVQVNGPDRVYGNGMANFTAKVTNSGNVAAESVNVTVHWPSRANLADMGEVQLKTDDSANQASNKKQAQGQPTKAPKQDSQQQNDNQEQTASDSQQMQDRSFEIDRLEPGQTAQFSYAIRTDNLKEIPTEVRASHVCTIEVAEDQAKSTAEASATAMTTAQVVRLPALQIAVIDDEDPVKSGSKVQYTIQVWNEGDAPDHDVELIAKLPDNLKFDSANGPTEVQNVGDTVRFSPIKSMDPGARAEFTVTAKPTGTGDARFEAALKSKMLQSEVVSEEPTRLFDPSNN